MGVQDGFPVSAGYTNPKFISKNTSDVMPFPLGFTGSGPSIADIQAAVNKLYTATGASESQTGTVYNAPAGTISNGDSYEESLSILAGKFDAATGHNHTGAAGDGPILDVVLSIAASGGPGPIFGDIQLVGSENLTIIQSGNNFIFSASGGSGTLSPLTTVGDIYGFDGDNARVPVGLDGQRLIADSNQSVGVRYQDENPKNYILNSDAYLSVSPWVTYADAASNIPVNGTGGTATGLTFAVSSSSPLRNSSSFLMTQANTTSLQGKGVSYDFSIDSADLAQVLSISFDFNASPTFVASNGITPPLNDGTTTTNAGNSDIEVFIYDVTNSILIPVSPQVITATGANNSKFQGVFQTSSNSTSYRLIFHVATTSANATGWQFKFDNVSVAPQPVVTGVPSTDFADYTPVTQGLGTISSNNSQWRRVGDSIELQIRFTVGTPTASQCQIGLPPGLIINTKGSAINHLVGYATRSNTGSDFARQFSVIAIQGNSYINLGIMQTSGTSDPLATVNGSTIFTTSDPVTLFARIPITGWSSNVQMSNDTSTRAIAMSATSSVTVLGVSTFTKIINPTVEYDDTGSYDPSTGIYTVPVSGKYRVTGGIASATSLTVGQQMQISAYKNGSAIKGLCQVVGNGSAAFYIISGSAEVSCVSGDQLALYGFSTVSITLDSNSTLTYFQVERLSGPATIAATETVGMSAYKNGGSQTTSSSYQTVSSYTATQVDTHGQFNSSTGIYTIPISGPYYISGNIAFTANVIGIRLGRILKNAASIGIGAEASNLSSSDAITFNVSGIINCIAGDQINLQAFQNSGGSLAYVTDTDIVTRLDIFRIGN